MITVRIFTFQKSSYPDEHLFPFKSKSVAVDVLLCDTACHRQQRARRNRDKIKHFCYNGIIRKDERGCLTCRKKKV